MTIVMIALLIWFGLGVLNWLVLRHAEESEFPALAGVLLGPLVWAAGVIMWVALALAGRTQAGSIDAIVPQDGAPRILGSAARRLHSPPAHREAA